MTISRLSRSQRFQSGFKAVSKRFQSGFSVIRCRFRLDNNQTGRGRGGRCFLLHNSFHFKKQVCVHACVYLCVCVCKCVCVCVCVFEDVTPQGRTELGLRAQAIIAVITIICSLAVVAMLATCFPLDKSLSVLHSPLLLLPL